MVPKVRDFHALKVDLFFNRTLTKRTAKVLVFSRLKAVQTKIDRCRKTPSKQSILFYEAEIHSDKDSERLQGTLPERSTKVIVFSRLKAVQTKIVELLQETLPEQPSLFYEAEIHLS